MPVDEGAEGQAVPPAALGTDRRGKKKKVVGISSLEVE